MLKGLTFEYAKHNSIESRFSKGRKHTGKEWMISFFKMVKYVN